MAVFQYLKLFPNKLRTVVDSVFEFEDAQKAYEKLLSKQFFGKIVVRDNYLAKTQRTQRKEDSSYNLCALCGLCERKVFPMKNSLSP